MNVPVKISEKRLRQLIEGARLFWIDRFTWKRKASETSLSFSLREDECDPPVVHHVNADRIYYGLVKMANAKRDEGGHHFEDVMEDGEDDMWTGDAVVQFAIFGELKYG